MTRSVKEWRGKTDDTPVPPRVRNRVFMACGGVCALAGRKIQTGEAWDIDHIIALANGGENRESNLQCVLRVEHRKKTADDVRQKAKDARVRSKHIGVRRAKAVIPGSKASMWKRRIDGTTIKRDKT